MKKKLLLILVILCISLLTGCANLTTTRKETTSTLPENTEYYSLLSNVITPKRMLYPNSKDFKTEDEYLEAIDKYNEERTSRKVSEEELSTFNTFFKNTLEEFLLDNSNTNTVYSPLNIYLALSMLYETTASSSKDELKSILGISDDSTYKNIVKKIFEASYDNEEELKSLLANSIWLSDSIEYKKDCIDILGEYYNSYVYEGKMGSSEYTSKLQNFVNENTAHMLEDYVKDLELTRDTVYAIVSTIYFKGSWSHVFNDFGTLDDTFHLDNSDIITKFMNKEYCSSIYTGDNFTSVSDSFSVANYKIDYILPNKGVSVSDFVKSQEFRNFLISKDGFEKETGDIRLSVPKFDVSSKLDLIGHLKNLGVNKIFNPIDSDFSALTNLKGLFIDKIEHAARVKVDEEGLEAAAYTFIGNKATSVGPKEFIDFKLDRAFIFVLRNTSGIPLFIGVINNPSVTK